ncbi:hypothetical protein T492DRAFT_840421 [Pavlovales sp. CCMP2436]|nr:hypothetical protein T492DRAFT_840421 [Pavlovales sp. CCMP2436]
MNYSYTNLHLLPPAVVQHRFVDEDNQDDVFPLRTARTARANQGLSVRPRRAARVTPPRPGMMTMTERKDMLNDMYLDVHGTNAPVFLGNKFIDPGPPPKTRLLPAIQATFDSLYKKMLVDGRRQEKIMADRVTIRAYWRARAAREKQNRLWETSSNPQMLKDKAINVNHIGMLRWLAQSKDTQWFRSVRTDAKSPPLDKGIKYFIEISR